MKLGNPEAMICDYCKGNMMRTHNESGDALENSCRPRRYVFGRGDTRWSIPYRNFSNIKGVRCPRCNVSNGGTHHEQCDEEICPKCKVSFFKCDCGF